MMHMHACWQLQHLYDFECLVLGSNRTKSCGTRLPFAETDEMAMETA